VCAVDVSEVEDALDHLGCEARVVTLDPMRLPGGAVRDQLGAER
jgi:hypothetical protein